MAQKFAALPVHGDAFVLRRDDTVILVDGGGRSLLLAQELYAYDSSLAGIDIIVCTHSDADHAGGLKSIYKEWRRVFHRPLTVGQFWLPALWTTIIPRALQVRKVRDKLDSNVLDALDRRFGDKGQDAPNRQAGEGSLDQGGEPDVADEARFERLDLWAARFAKLDLGSTFVENEAELLDEFRRSFAAYSKLEIMAGAARVSFDEAMASAWVDSLLMTANSILVIVGQALVHKADIHWFDYNLVEAGAYPYGGRPGVLEPVNAVEVGPPPPSGASLLAMLSLSRVNIASLVFLAPENDDDHAVLFCADSPFEWYNSVPSMPVTITNPAPGRPYVATAPHHGAASNNGAYPEINIWSSKALWVRSGGKPYHPDGDFQRFSDRTCTGCPHSGYPLSRVEVDRAASRWKISPSRACRC